MRGLHKKILSMLLISTLTAGSLSLSGCGEPKDSTGMYKLDKVTNELIINEKSLKKPYTATNADNDRVFYQIFVGSFSDSNGDGIGDIRGIINRMDYLNDGNPDSGKSLGVEGLWLSPVFKSPSYHKYDVTDYYEIDSTFGTMDDLRELVSICHERGVKVILDLPINHTSTSNKWFQSFKSAREAGYTTSEYYDYYSVNDSTSAGSRRFYKLGTSKYYYEGNFSSDMPELNFENPDVKQLVVDVAEFYLNDVKIDGFRFDAAKYIYFGEEKRNVEFWEWYIAELRNIQPDIYTVAEVWDSDSLTQNYASAINCFSFTMGQSMGLLAEVAKRGDVNKLTKYTESYLNIINAKSQYAMLCPFLANHDMDRAAGYLTVSSGFAYAAANILILGPGSPFIYYGEEIGMKGTRGSANTDANRRLAMLWGDGDTVKNPTGSTYDSSKQPNGTVTDQYPDATSLYNHYKKLIMLRKANPEIAYGEYKALSFPDTHVGGFICTMKDTGSSVLVIHNTTDSEYTVDLKDVTDFSINELRGYAGVGKASLNGTVLTLEGQTSVVIK